VYGQEGVPIKKINGRYQNAIPNADVDNLMSKFLLIINKL
jgi:hypothetical protein